MGNKYNNKFVGTGPRTVICGNNTRVTINKNEVTDEGGEVTGNTSKMVVSGCQGKVTINGKRV